MFCGQERNQKCCQNRFSFFVFLCQNYRVLLLLFLFSSLIAVVIYCHLVFWVSWKDPNWWTGAEDSSRTDRRAPKAPIGNRLGSPKQSATTVMSATCNVQRVATSCLWQCFHNYWLARCKIYTCIHKTTDIIGIKSYAPLTEHFPLQPIYEPRYRPRLANCNRFYYTLRPVKHFQKGYTHYVQMQKEALISKFQRKALPSIIVNVLVTVFQSTSKGILLTDWFASDFLTLRQLRVTTTYSTSLHSPSLRAATHLSFSRPWGVWMQPIATRQQSDNLTRSTLQTAANQTDIRTMTKCLWFRWEM